MANPPVQECPLWGGDGMKVLSLQCAQGHRFEGWFGSEVDFQDQQTQGLLTCPLCSDSQVMKLPSAPRLNLHTNSTRRDDVPVSGRAASCDLPPSERPPSDGTDTAELPQAVVQAAWLRALREVFAHTEDVGRQFPEQALRMHHGEEAMRAIRGQATPQQARALLDEGVELLPLPMLPGLKETLQ